MEVESKTMRSESTTKKKQVESAVMCCECTGNFAEEEPHEEPEKVAKKPIKKMEKQKHEEEQAGPTLDTGSRLKISIKEFSWEREDDGSTLEMEEPKQQDIVYIMNLEDGLRKNGTNCTMKKAQTEKTCCEK